VNARQPVSSARLLPANGPACASVATVLGGNPIVPRTRVDGATGMLFFDLNSPISSEGTIDAWRIYAADGSGVGQVELEIFRPAGVTWRFVGASQLETVAWGRENTFALATPIAVQAGDLIAWWYPNGTVPSIVFDGSGGTLNNHDWSWDPIPRPHNDIPNMLAPRTSWHGPWGVNSRTYSIQVLGTAVSEPSTLATFAGLGAIRLIAAWRRRQRTT
jgi:hypothetical protein